MSVVTRADEILNDVRNNVQSALDGLSQIVITKDVWGADEFSKVYEQQMQDALNKLLEVKALL